jgi:hypothetical protein
MYCNIISIIFSSIKKISYEKIKPILPLQKMGIGGCDILAICISKALLNN